MSYTLEERIKKIEESCSYEELIGKGILPKVHNENYYFVSYSHKDYKAVLKDILELQEKGINLWYDSGMRAGENWEEIAKQFISKFQCKGVIFYLSENSLTSSACSTEIDYVLNSDKKFFSINLPLGNGEITDGATMAQTLKNEGAPISPATVDLAQKAFSDKHLYLPYSATIENKKDSLEEILVGEDLFEFEYSAYAFPAFFLKRRQLPLAKLTSCRDTSLIKIQLPINISREKIKNVEALEKDESNDRKLYDTLKLTKISGTVFANFNYLEEVILPNTITQIGDSCFRNCHNLKTINLEQLIHLKEIAEKTFLNCSSLSNLTIPNSVTRIDERAFEGCKSLTKVKIGKSVKNIGENAFRCCKSLANIVIPDSTIDISNHAFYECNSLINVKIGNKVRSIGENAFYGCKSLTRVEIPNSVRTIGDWAFYGCKSVSSIVIGKSVERIGEWAFSGCYNLKTIHNYSKLELDLDRKNLGIEEKVEIKNHIDELENNTYDFIIDKNSNMGEIVNSQINAIQSNENNFNEDMGKDKVFTDYNQYLEKLNSYSVSDCNLILRKILGVSESSVLDTEYIEYNEFAIGVLELVKCHYTDIVSYEIPEFIDGKKVTKIKYSAFEDCEKLARITLPNSITHIGDMAFKNCVSLESINIPNKVRNIYRGTFENCTSLAQVTFSQSLKIIEPRAFYGCSSLTQINLPYYLTKVSVQAFGKCTSLQKVIFESSLEHVGESAFKCCSALTEVIFRGENVKTLYDCAFSGCSALEHFTIPASVTSIGMWTFSGCNCLKTIHNYSKLELDREELGIGEKVEIINLG